MQDEDFIAAVMNVKADSLRRYTQLSEEMEKARGEYMAAGSETALLVPLREGRSRWHPYPGWRTRSPA